MLRPGLLLAFTVTLALGPLPSALAQDGDEAAAGKTDGQGDVERATAEKIRLIKEKAAAEGEKLEVSDVVATGLERLVQIVGSVDPVRIPPGGTGTLKLLLGMREGALIRSAADLSIDYAAQQGPAALGAFTLGEPTLVKSSPAFNGAMAYETYALVTVPLTVRGDAAFGKYPLRAQVLASVTDPVRGSAVGRFRGAGQAELVVGPAIPTPTPLAVGPGDAVASSSTPGQGGSAATTPPSGEVKSTPDEHRVIAAPVEHVASAGNGDEVSSSMTEPASLPASQSDSTLLIAGGGVLAVVLLLVVLGARGKR